MQSGYRVATVHVRRIDAAACPDRNANAAYIVLAVNHHRELVEALQLAVDNITEHFGTQELYEFCRLEVGAVDLSKRLNPFCPR